MSTEAGCKRCGELEGYLKTAFGLNSTFMKANDEMAREARDSLFRFVNANQRAQQLEAALVAAGVAVPEPLPTLAPALAPPPEATP